MDWCSPGFPEFSVFFGVLLLVETVFLEWTFHRISTMRTLTVEILEWMWAWFTLLGFQSRRVEFIVSFTTLCKVTMIVSKMRPITFGTFWVLNSTDPTKCPHFQQFLHWGTSGFMLAPLTVVMTFPMLNRLLIIFLALLLFWVSQISIQTIAMSDLGETLMILGFDASTISLNMWLFLRMCSISSEEIHVFDLSMK